MWRVGRWAPLFLCLLQSVPGWSRLAPPRNVTLFSQNFTVYLTWLPGLGNPPDVSYFVTYQGYPSSQHWKKVGQCAGTKALVCPLMCLKRQDLYNKFKGRVQAASASARGRSPPVESKYLHYLLDVEPAPPTLVLTQMEKILWVNATYQLPPCMPHSDLKYEVQFWKEGIEHKTQFPATEHNKPMEIPLQQGANGRHCLSARTIYTFTVAKYSHFSEPSCIFIGAPGANWAVLTLPLLLPLLVAAATVGVIWKTLEGNPWFQRVKMPQALDFSEYRYPMVTFQPSAPEFPDDLILGPQKELTIRISPGPRVRDPGTLQAGPEKDSTEDEDEDTDDSDSVQSYLEPPLFMREKLQVMGHSETAESGVGSGGSEDSSAWDSSDRSWSSTVDSSLKDEAGSSSCLDKKEPDQEPDGDGHQEALPCLEFSEDSGTMEELLKDDLSRWRIWGSLSPKRDLVPGESPVSLQTLTFSWDRHFEEEEGEEEEEEEEEEVDDWESEPKGSIASCWDTSSLQRTEVKDRMLGDYMAR
ncbi:interferon lambda receptor 1 [Phodopus roborovskii]|uniref:Interferon lambda receptor 1 n=1 Tax=Phodopus roborovskii TaxID=109678 RepID=A0AAV0AAG1_PHORO|nr:interferon lambda receptor 1 [Phodopus roborovskii]CAH7438311.1 Ifnlr1 [Phodopus roborovskii]